MDQEERRRKRQQRSPSRGDGASASSGKHRGGGKKPIKVVYISNPMRVKTSAAGFRALVQELTGRHADPSNSKYGQEDPGAGAAAASLVDCGAAQGLRPPGAAASSETIVVASLSPSSADHLRHDAGTQQGGDYCYDDKEDAGFGSQLLELENNYAAFSPTLLYDHHPHSKFPFG
ncbi:hypothetical protein BS78_03G393800 [Paspalum vaginatum]|nr:hypothetical protein BS78_03G393800 [Paspalum vaginatum]